MNKRRKTALFSFSSPDQAEARLWLEAMAEQGWELVKVKQGFFSRAVFEPLVRDDLRYDLDIADSFLKDFDKQQEYDRLLSDAGWDRVGRIRDLKVYKSHPGRSPAPIQTDPDLARKRYWRESLIPALVTVAILVAIVLLILAGLNLDGPFHLYYLFQSNAYLVFWCLLLVSVVLLLVQPLWSARRNTRRAQVGSAAPSPSVIRRARLQGIFSSVSLLLPLLANILIGVSTVLSIGAPWLSGEEVRAWPVVLMEDFGVDGLSPYGEIQRDSRLLRSRWVRQSLSAEPDAGRLWEERFDCRYGWVADLVVGGLLNDEYDYTPAELGFDESYVDGKSRLLLRQGNTVVQLDAPFDLTTDTALEVLWDRLEWEG